MNASHNEKVTDLRERLTAAIEAFNENEAAAGCPVVRVLAVEEVARLRRELAEAEKGGQT